MFVLLVFVFEGLGFFVKMWMSVFEVFYFVFMVGVRI